MANILIVDDRAVNRQYLATLLRYCGHHILEAADGREALEIVRREHPNLVVTDILMPVMDGCQFARAVQTDPTTATTPIVFYTATYRQREAHDLATECGVRYVLTKPSAPQAIVDVVNDALGVELQPVAADFARRPVDRLTDGFGNSVDLHMAGLRFSSLIELGLDLVGEHEPGHLVEKFCRAAQDIIGAKFAAVGLLADDRATIEHFCSTGPDVNLPGNGVKADVEHARSEFHELFATKMRSLLAGQRSFRSAWRDEEGETPGCRAGPKCFLVVPVHVGPEINGWLYLVDKLREREFNDEDERIAQTLAAQLSVTFENARLHAAERAHAAALESEIARRQAAETIESQQRVERERAEEQLRKLSRAVEQSPVAIVITDTKGIIEYVNPKFESITGYTAAEVRGRNPSILKSGKTSLEEYRNLWKTIRAGGEWHGEFQNKRKDGNLFWEFASISPIRDSHGHITHYVAVKEDITEKKQLEAQFLRAQRLESIGALAAGVAHDLNNILAPILMCAPLLHGKVGSESLEEVVSTIEASAKRGAEVVKQVLSFGRGSQGERQPQTVKHLLREMERVAHETFPKTIRVETSREPGLWKVTGDATQLHQVLLNLCVNARDAMPDGGTLRLRAKNAEIDESYASMLPDGRPGSFVMVEVADTGTGIPREVMDRIFEPFYTTKEEGKGTGLGLSTVRKIVLSHEGFLTVRSEPGTGTTFQVYLPATLDETLVEDDQCPVAVTTPAVSNQLILVVDDEASIRTITRMVLEMHGYEVLTAAEGSEAVAVYAQNSARIAAVVSDIVMPLMDGVALVGALRRINPAVKVIAVSGFTDKSRLASLETLKVEALIAKPYTAETLLNTLESVFHGSV
jgi:PAS domain S-box-containing protein